MCVAVSFIHSIIHYVHGVLSLLPQVGLSGKDRGIDFFSAPLAVRRLLKNRAHKDSPKDGTLCHLCDTAAWAAVVVCEACIFLHKTHAKKIALCPACAKTGFYGADHNASVSPDVLFSHCPSAVRRFPLDRLQSISDRIASFTQ